MRIETLFRLPRRGDASAAEVTALVAAEEPQIPSIFLPASGSAKPNPDLQRLASNFDIRSITPRQMVKLSRALYRSGHVDRDQYQALAFQSELMPNFEHTIGALTGERAEPDRPRDYVEVWRKRLAFEINHFPEDDRILSRTRKILNLLDSMEASAKRGQNPLSRARQPGK